LPWNEALSKTGHSSLAYLKTLPVCSLKIDQVFINSLGDAFQAERLGQRDDGVNDFLVALIHGKIRRRSGT